MCDGHPLDREQFDNFDEKIREELEEHGICHAILETEDEICNEVECHPNMHIEEGHHH